MANAGQEEEGLQLFGDGISIDTFFDEKTGTYIFPWLAQSIEAGRTVMGDREYWEALLGEVAQPPLNQRSLAAILDTGMLIHHPLLKPRIVESIDCTGEDDPEDKNGHGTGVALVEVMTAPLSALLNIKVYPARQRPRRTYREQVEIVAQGVRCAISRGARIINLSVGASRACKKVDEPLCAAIRDAIDAGIFVIVAGEAKCPAECHPDITAIGEYEPASEKIYTNTPPFVVSRTFGEVTMVPITQVTQQLAADYYNRGAAQENLGRYDEALVEYTFAIERDPNYVDAYVNRGNVYSTLGRYGEALEDYTKAIELRPTMAWAYYDRGNTYAQLQRYDEALTDLTKAIGLQASFAPAYRNRAEVYNRLERYQEALADYDKAIDIDRDYAPTYYDRAFIYARLQRYREALTDFTKVIEIEPDNKLAYYNRGVTYGYLERYEQALLDYTHVISMDADYADAYANRGNVYNKLRCHDEALADYNKAIEINPDHMLAHRNAGALLYNHGELAAALPYLERAAELGDLHAAYYAAHIREEFGREGA